MMRLEQAQQSNILDRVIHGDSLSVLRTLPDNSVDAIVCDPPAGISFMNKTFDSDRGGRDFWIAWLHKIMAEALRALKPGGHAFVWALPRTSHWTGMALEDAGWEIREKCYHIFGSGFPKSKNLGNGLGTALKPAVEEWILARKPLSEPTIAANVLKWGTGALAIDKCRVGNENTVRQNHAPRFDGSHYNNGKEYNIGDWQSGSTQGRWPSNLLLSHSVWCVPNGVKKVRANGVNTAIPSDRKNGAMLQNMKIHGSVNYNDSEGMEQVEDWLCDESCPIRLLDEQSGMRKSGARVHPQGEIWEVWQTNTSKRGRNTAYEASEGGASRYFQRFAYIPKASRAERNSGCEGLPINDDTSHNLIASKWTVDPRHPNGGYPQSHSAPLQNTHPTVKSIALCRYLVRMITPPGGIVLDCFAGSGSTLVAAIHEGMHFIGIEQLDTPEEPYISIARARIEQAFREVQ